MCENPSFYHVFAAFAFFRLRGYARAYVFKFFGRQVGGRAGAKHKDRRVLNEENVKVKKSGFA